MQVKVLLIFENSRLPRLHSEKALYAFHILNKPGLPTQKSNNGKNELKDSFSRSFTGYNIIYNISSYCQCITFCNKSSIVKTIILRPSTRNTERGHKLKVIITTFGNIQRTSIEVNDHI